MPDIQGFVDAQRQLVDVMGTDVDFEIPVAKVYDPSVALDPETGEPYDPTEVPTSGGGATHRTVKCGVVRQSITPNDPIFQGPSGVRRTEDCALIVKPELQVLVTDATAFNLNGIPYKLTEWLPDSVANTEHRWIAFGEAK